MKRVFKTLNPCYKTIFWLGLALKYIYVALVRIWGFGGVGEVLKEKTSERESFCSRRNGTSILKQHPQKVEKSELKIFITFKS